MFPFLPVSQACHSYHCSGSPTKTAGRCGPFGTLSKAASERKLIQYKTSLNDLFAVVFHLSSRIIAVRMIARALTPRAGARFYCPSLFIYGVIRAPRYRRRRAALVSWPVPMMKINGSSHNGSCHYLGGAAIGSDSAPIRQQHRRGAPTACADDYTSSVITS